MKPRTHTILVLAILVALAVWSSMPPKTSRGLPPQGGACCPLLAAPEAKPGAVGASPTATNNAAPQVIAYYFHGTVRCDTCLLIEKLAMTVVEQEFGADLALNRLVFRSVDYEQPENTHFLADYRLPCPSLVMVKRRNGNEEDWKLLADTWQLVHEPVRLNAYVEAEVRNFLSEPRPAAETDHSGLPPVTDAH